MKRVQVQQFVLLGAIVFALFAASVPHAAAVVEKTGDIELFLSQETTIIVGEKYDYSATLVYLDPCDKVLSSTSLCIPSITIIIYQKDKKTGEILESTSIDHLSWGSHTLDISYETITINSLNVVQIQFVDKKAKIDIGFTTKSTEVINGALSYQPVEDNTVNATVGKETIVCFGLSNTTGEAEPITVTVTKAKAFARLSLEGTTISTGQAVSLLIEPGERTIDIGVTPQTEGHQTISYTVTIGEQTYEETVFILSHSPTSSNVIFTNEASFNDMLRDNIVVNDLKMDSIYLLGFAIVFLTLGGVLGFIQSSTDEKSGRRPSRK